MSGKLIRDRDKREFFVGYGTTPRLDRRVLLGLTVLGLAGGAFGAAWLARGQRGAGNGSWDMAETVTPTGALSLTPYPLLRTLDLDGQIRTVLLACDTKCGTQSRLEGMDLRENHVAVRGSLIRRGRHIMMAVANEDDWITPAPQDGSVTPLPVPSEEDLGTATLRGEILDSKCWFGAMRPSEGTVHKACAMLCIAGGLAPYFHARGGGSASGPMMITDPVGEALVQPILRYVAEPVEASGQIVRIEDLVQFRIDPATLQMLV